MANSQPARQRIVVPFAGHVIGEGFNSETVERVGTGLRVADTGEDPEASGQIADFKFQVLTSQASMEKALKIGAEIEARYGLLSGGAKFDFAENSSVDLSSTFILASCVVKNAVRFGTGFELTEPAEAMIKGLDLGKFKVAFGDRFTAALHTGGEFHALVRVTSSDKVHQRTISASLHAELNGLAAAVSFKGSLQTAMKDSSSHTAVNIEVHQTGGVGSQVQIPGSEADNIRAHMNQFAEAAHSHSAAFEAELVTYDTLALPFPSLMELEDRRLVFEDCLERRQRYLTAISELTFAQSKDGEEIFEDLPSPEQLVSLQNRFRRVLGGVMTHARTVTTGATDPVPFVADDEPPMPRFKRRVGGTFRAWWSRAKAGDPTLLQDEKSLIQRIGSAAAPLLSVPVEEATAETMERAADQIEKLDLDETSPPLRSLARLPEMIDPPLRRLRVSQTELRDLTGVEGFSRLGFLISDFGKLRDLDALAGAAGLEDLRLRVNEIDNLTPLRALTALEILCLQGNQIESLEPLRELLELRTVTVAGTAFHSVSGETGFLENPITDARALAQLPHISNPFTSAASLRLKLFDQEGTPGDTGDATRVGDTNRFQFVPAGGGGGEQIQLMGLREWSDLNALPSPVVIVALNFANRGTGVAVTKPGDRSAFLPPDEVLKLFFETDDFQFDAGPLIGSDLPGVLVEAQAT